MEDFMADLVHELKNPVAGILSAAELADRSASEDTRRFLRVIDREGHRISRLLDDLKELISVEVRLDAGQSEPAAISKVLDGLVKAYPYHRKEGIHLAFVDKTNTKLKVDADHDRLAQAVLNLIDNAISFSPKDTEVLVYLKHLSEQEEPAGPLMIEIMDRGPGLQETDKIFERWYTDRPEEEASEHTGLGLAIVKSIVEGYGGGVEAEPREGGGAIFRILLPVVL